MLALTHLIVTLLFIQIFLLDRNDAFVGLVFGVFIDLDHLIGLGDYAHENGVKAVFDLDNLMNPGGQWKSILHNPVALVLVGPLAYASRLAIPVVFWGLHVAMDLVQDGYLGQFSHAEAMLAFLAGAFLISLRFSKCIDSGHEMTLTQFLKSEVRSMRGMLAARQAY